MTTRLAIRMPPQIRLLLGSLAVAGILAAILFSYLLFVVTPQLMPMLDHDYASNYSTVFSRLKVEDLTALGISPPVEDTPLSFADARRILQRLHDTGRFPEWKPEFLLSDSKGKPYEFSIRPRPKENRGVTFSSGKFFESGDFVVSVKPSTLPYAVEDL